MLLAHFSSTLSARFRVAVLALVFSLSANFAFAQTAEFPVTQPSLEGKKNQPAPITVSQPGKKEDDSALIAAVQSKRNVHYVEGGNLVVTKILPDDNHGLPHQSWEAQLSDGSIITVVYNSNMGERVPVEEGMTFSVGGQFIWTKDGGLIHWLHHDPKKKRPDGWVFLEDIVYGIPAAVENVLVH
ncbi:MAG: hypothetical protein K0R29_1355 [Pseudobdellovibrio sp.]|jgi:hypothetical protein|nr:hypothetical protein [Pseudobdellovibrio sp.]